MQFESDIGDIAHQVNYILPLWVRFPYSVLFKALHFVQIALFFNKMS